MKKTLSLILFLAITIASFAQSDEEAVKNAINTAYVGGIHNDGPIDDIRKGFHSSFVMFVLSNNEIKTTTIDEWVKNTEKSRAANPAPPATKSSAKFITVSVVGNSASVILDLYRGDKKVFTDNLLLYKFNEGWRIVAKSFYRHP
jgi:hypothetical protein